MPDTPIVTFTLQAEKAWDKKQIRWECKINSDLLRNGNWKLEIKSVALTALKKHTVKKEEDGEEQTIDCPIFEISCNLISNNFRWFENIIGRYGQKQTYREQYPIEFIQSKTLTGAKEQLLFFKNKKHQISTPSSDDMIIVMKPVEKSYKFNVSCSATIMISLYKD